MQSVQARNELSGASRIPVILVFTFTAALVMSFLPHSLRAHKHVVGPHPVPRQLQVQLHTQHSACFVCVCV